MNFIPPKQIKLEHNNHRKYNCLVGNFQLTLPNTKQNKVIPMAHTSTFLPEYLSLVAANKKLSVWQMNHLWGSVAQWSELGIWMRKTRVLIPDLDSGMNLSSVISGANSPCFVNSQLVCLLPVGILKWERGGILTWHKKVPLGGYFYLYLFSSVTVSFL